MAVQPGHNKTEIDKLTVRDSPELANFANLTIKITISHEVSAARCIVQ